MTFKIETLGCKVNQYESQLLYEELLEAGLSAVEEQPQVVIVNSCTVTGEADHKTLKLLRRLRKENPHSILVLTGCFPQVNPDAAQIPEVDLVVGGRDKEKVREVVLSALQGKSPSALYHTPFQSKETLWDRGAKGFEGHTRAFMKIQEGCNRYCSYCIIPTARGPLRHKSLEAIQKETAAMVSQGYKEIVLVGINLAMYGFGEELDLADAVNAAAAVAGDFRLRLGSTEPELMTDALLRKLKACPKLCPSFHLPLQSGCTRTLKEMNRRYTNEEFRERVAAVREIFGELAAISTDIMVGFPGETEEDFLSSATFFAEMGFADAHIFAYSPREGTKAAERLDQIPTAVKEQRSKELSRLLALSKSAYLEKRVKTTAEVIVEKNQKGGHDQYYSYVSLPEDMLLPRGSVIPLEITHVHLRGLQGVPLQ